MTHETAQTREAPMIDLEGLERNPFASLKMGELETAAIVSADGLVVARQIEDKDEPRDSYVKVYTGLWSGGFDDLSEALLALPELIAMARRVEAEAAGYASASAAAENVIDGLMAENARLKAALEPDMFWDQENPEQPYYDVEELLREQDYDRDRDIILDTQEAIRCADGAYFCRINSPSEDSETDDAEIIIRKLTDDERKQWRAVYRAWLSMQYLKPLFARTALKEKPQ